MPTLAEHLNWHWKEWRHARVVRAVLDTPPIVARDDGVVLFSMIGSKVLHPYLVAVKTLATALGRGRVVILDDGSLTAADRAVLRHHLDGPEIRSIADVDTGEAPRGGTWERLLSILDLRRNAYVIQLDSDTITVGDPSDVREAIDAGRSFSLRGEADAELTDCDRFAVDARAFAAGAKRLHVQRACEAAMGGLELPGVVRPRYFRGCSGFAGFAPSDSGRETALAFSRAMTERLGAARWAEWGSEQVTSTMVVANEADPLLLPYGRYLNFWDEGVPGDARFVHFVGTCRFNGETYMDATAQAIARLR